jgi:hypothetical protein
VEEIAPSDREIAHGQRVSMIKVMNKARSAPPREPVAIS